MLHTLQKANSETFYIKQKVNLSSFYLRKANNWCRTYPKQTCYVADIWLLQTLFIGISDVLYEQV